MANLRGKKILFVDDDKFNMRPTIEALEAEEAEVKVLTNGTALLQYLRQNINSLPDLIILDIMMASGDEIVTEDQGRSTGAKAYQYIRNAMKLKNFPIIVSTVVSDPIILQKFNNDEYLELIQKPYLYGELRVLIDDFF